MLGKAATGIRVCAGNFLEDKRSHLTEWIWWRREKHKHRLKH
jgi:hypothetical protein